MANAQSNASSKSQQYAKQLADFANDNAKSPYIVGDLYLPLSQYLVRAVEEEPDAEVLVCVHPAAGKACGRAQPIIYTRSSELHVLKNWVPHGSTVREILQSGVESIVFLCGHQQPQCVAQLGAAFNVDPSFFQKHLEYLRWGRSRRSFAIRSLPSSSPNILRLRVVTLGERPGHFGPGSQPQIDALRSSYRQSMERYLNDVSKEHKLTAGTSVVRAVNAHSTRYFSIEQDVTATVQRLPSGRSAVLIWVDFGHDLEKGPDGPWHGERFSSLASKSPFLPSVQTFSTQHAAKVRVKRNHSVPHSAGAFEQSALSWAKQYGATLDPTIAAVDSFYCITELLRCSSNSICQLLSLIESLVDESTGYDIYSSPEYSVSSLAYHVDILHRFEHRLRENIHDIEHQRLSWPRSPAVDDVDPTYTNPFQMESENSVKRILIDFKELLARTERLNMRCQNGISMCMSRASVAESQRAIAQAWQVGLLTWIAFLYIPLSFTTSFFGMNIESFGSGTLTLGTWFAISAPLVAFSYAVAMLASQPRVRRLTLRLARAIHLI